MDTHDPHHDPHAAFDGPDSATENDTATEEPSPRGARYDDARAAFDALGLEDKAVFLMEAATRTITRGIEDGARRLSDELNRAFDDLERAAKSAGEHAKQAAEAAREEAEAARSTTVPPKPPHSTSEVQGGGAPATPIDGDPLTPPPPPTP